MKLLAVHPFDLFIFQFILYVPVSIHQFITGRYFGRYKCSFHDLLFSDSLRTCRLSTLPSIYHSPIYAFTHLYLVVLDQHDNSFDHPVTAGGFIFRFEIMSEYAGEGLPEESGKIAFQFFQKLIGGIAGFPVNQF